MNNSELTNPELLFFLNNGITQTGGGGGEKNNDNIEPKNIDIIKAYRKKNRELHKRIEELEGENKKLKNRLGKIY